MGGDLLPGGLGQAVPQVPPVADLHRAGQCRAGRLPVCPRAVPAHDLDPGMLAEPAFDDIGGAPFEHVNAAAGLGVDQDGRVDGTAAQREVVDPEHPRHLQRGKRDPQQRPQQGVPGRPDAQRGRQPRPGPPS